MRLPVIRGLIRRRLLVNFRVDPAVIQRLLPAPFRPKLHDGYAIAGLCLIRVEEIRPIGFPCFLGISSENAAHRIAVAWEESGGTPREGVFIPRRDTGSWMNHLAGGRLFPGEHQIARFRVTDDGHRIAMDIRAHDGRMAIQLTGSEADSLPATSCFGSLAESSDSTFFGNAHDFPAGSVTFDHALIMRDLAHQWREAPAMPVS